MAPRRAALDLPKMAAKKAGKVQGPQKAGYGAAWEQFSAAFPKCADVGCGFNRAVAVFRRSIYRQPNPADLNCVQPNEAAVSRAEGAAPNRAEGGSGAAPGRCRASPPLPRRAIRRPCRGLLPGRDTLALWPELEHSLSLLEPGGGPGAPGAGRWVATRAAAYPAVRRVPAWPPPAGPESAGGGAPLVAGHSPGAVGASRGRRRGERPKRTRSAGVPPPGSPRSIYSGGSVQAAYGVREEGFLTRTRSEPDKGNGLRMKGGRFRRSRSPLLLCSQKDPWQHLQVHLKVDSEVILASLGTVVGEFGGDFGLPFGTIFGELWGFFGG
ncbi:uncharacterized protein FYW23_016040 [Sylvia borin]